MADKYMTGTTIADICVEYGVNRRAIVKHFDVMGIRRRKWASIRQPLADLLDEVLDRKSLDSIQFRGSDVVQLLKLQAQINRELSDESIPSAIVQYLPLANQIVYADDIQALTALRKQIESRLVEVGSRTNAESAGIEALKAGVDRLPTETKAPPRGVSNGPSPVVCDITGFATDAEIEIDVPQGDVDAEVEIPLHVVERH
jgi:hypothetical protein